METLRRVVNNTLISLLGQAITWVSTIALTVAYGRYLSDVKFGELYFALTFVLLIGIFLEFGFNQQLVRDVAQDESKTSSYFSNALFLKAILWVLVYVFIILICLLLGYSPEQRALVEICGITLFIRSLVNVVSGLHFAAQRTAFPAIGSILEKGLSALVGIVLLVHGANVVAMAYVLLGGMIVSALWQTFWFFRLEKITFGLDRAVLRDLIRTSIPFMAYGILGVIYYRIDTVLLSFMTSVAVVGWYGAAYRLFDTLVFLPALVINAIMYPVFSRLTVASEDNFRLAIEKSLNFLLFLGIPMSIGLVVAAPTIITVLYHQHDFLAAIPALQGLAPGLVFLYANSVFTAVLISTKNEKKITLMAAIALVFNLALNFTLIPFLHHVGAALATSLTELLLCCLSLAFLPRRLLPSGSVPMVAKALFTSLLMAMAIWDLYIVHITSIYVIFPVSMLVYFGSATILSAIPRKDMRALYKSLRKRS